MVGHQVETVRRRRADQFLRTNQRGQATVLFLAIVGIILLSLVFLFKSGRLVTEKMQLQNGADSAAYSASLFEARAMNFAAYTNRAMVANEVAIGQMVGLLSWADEVTAIGETFEIIGGVLDATVLLAEAGAALNVLGAGLIDAGETMTGALLSVAPVAIKGISTINQVYSVSQEVYHLTTLLLAANAVFQSLENNVPGTPGGNVVERLISPGAQGARLSPLGVIALAGHIPSYYSGFSKRYALHQGANEPDQSAGMGRLAATLRVGRDQFTSGDTTPVHGIRKDRGWDLKGHFSVNALLAKASLSFGFESKGGSEVRYKDTAYVWSAVDTADWVEEITIQVKVPKKHTYHIKLPGLPMGGGAYQANGGTQRLSVADMPTSLKRYGQPSAYGGAAEHTVSWLESGAKILENEVPNKPYANLRGYRDVVPGKEDSEPLAFVSPFFLVGVVRPMDDIEKQGPTVAGPFDLERAAELDGTLAAVAKAEIYHCRPDDLRYFQRADGKTERDNLFSPFWQARLAKTSDLDRFLGLALQQKIIWLRQQDTATVPGLDKVLKKLHELLEKLL
ncbi:TadE/TadG family type IV pilus assembly protein [Desulfofustis limnaeus]|uniref:Putative Flp pilus-assembly TadG-like N-terminal domain-containing protein n=1 Tax=Desulfofustis limnaeus TaxID=2740163 RepID=A0ABM7WDA2_9BACT|nr:pilus assembly protein TadG-related protein [Desulfofustis limnaeus]MDX9895165.1 pilus assembly protein TadG-related protein [Desulfofustis sp.]BDD88931.1 hypothetical protein DPPLL_32960 [Desulfofustis limnaeus]